MSQEITKEQIAAFDADFSAQRANRVAMNAVTNNGLLASAIRREAVEQDVHEYSISLEQGEICNQKQSGRCWMFAALNTLRYQVMKKYNLKTFELSQAYLFFWDKLEKSNYFLESILDTLDEPANGRLVSYLLMAPVNDGGQWDMLCNLIEKYGVVPKTAYPESKASSGSREMDMTLTEKLREDACILRKLHKEGKGLDELRARKTRMLGEIYRLLCICLGEPPKTFTFEYRDKNNNFHREEGLTPKSFFEKYVGVDLSDYVSLINAPTEDKPYGRSYTVQYLGNVKEGSAVRYLNLPIEELKKAAIAQMKDGVYLLNTSRGMLVESEALLDALKNGKIAGAGLDVYEEETEFFFEDRSEMVKRDTLLSLLVSMPNVVLTSHQAFLTNEALHNIAQVTLENLDAYFQDGTILNQVQ